MARTSMMYVKRGNALIAEDALTQEYLSGIPNETHVYSETKVPRSAAHHRLFFALLHVIFKAQMEPKQFSTEPKLLNAIKLATGHVEPVMDLQGNTHFVPASIDWATIDETEFKQFFDNAVQVILERIIPNCPRKGLEDEVMHMLGQRGPSDF